MTRLRATVAAPVLVLALALFTACSGSSDDGDTATDPVGSGGDSSAGSGASAGEMPTSVPPPSGDVIGVGTVMDLGQGEDPQLCLGAIAESYPPQCSGIPITNWDWKPVKDTSESSGTVRWGSYAVTGTYDGETFTVTADPMSSALYDPAAPTDNPFVTSCPEPEGGWTVVDESKVGFEDQDAVYAAAAQLPNYAGSFLDMDADKPGNASGTIVNVLVTDDPEGAEKALREVWGGPLCVTVAEHTEAELVEIQDGLSGLPGLLSSGPQLDKLVVDVVWDDGTLQSWADAAYGEGLVAIRSVLQPVG
jgi:hypothetical protein